MTTRLGPLDVHHTVTPGAATEGPPLVVVLLHGFGAPGDDLAGLADPLDVPPGTHLYFPEALYAMSDLMPIADRWSRAWWMIDMAAFLAPGGPRDLSGEVPEGLAPARDALSATVDAIVARHPGSKLVL